MGTKVFTWIDQDLCTGDGICAEICPSIFQMHTDGLAYVKETEWTSIVSKTEGSKDNDGEPIHQMAEGMAAVPQDLLEAVIESADECPGECIYIEVQETEE